MERTTARLGEPERLHRTDVERPVVFGSGAGNTQMCCYWPILVAGSRGARPGAGPGPVVGKVRRGASPASVGGLDVSLIFTVGVSGPGALDGGVLPDLQVGLLDPDGGCLGFACATAVGRIDPPTGDAVSSANSSPSGTSLSRAFWLR